MTLSPEKRAELLRQAGELRTEVSSLTAERDLALEEASQSIHDAKLVAEVMGLARQRDAAEAERDAAVNTTDDALAAMQAAVEAQEAVASLQNAGSSAPDREAETPIEIQVEPKEETTPPMDNSATSKKAGSR